MLISAWDRRDCRCGCVHLNPSFLLKQTFLWHLIFNFSGGKKKIKKTSRAVQIPKAIQSHEFPCPRLKVPHQNKHPRALTWLWVIPSQPWAEHLPRKHQQNPLKWIFHSFLLLGAEITKSYSCLLCGAKARSVFLFLELSWFAQRIFLPRIKGLEFTDPPKSAELRNPRAPGSRIALLC